MAVVATRSTGRLVYEIVNYTVLIVLAFLCIVPLIHIFAVSLSSGAAASSGRVMLWPIDANLKSYLFVTQRPEFMQAMWVSVQRVILGSAISMVLVTITAYPVSKEVERFRWRGVYVWFFFFTTLFGGGLIPTFLVVRETGLIDSIWALVIPRALPIFNVVLLLNFYRRLPKELEEAAYIDGASHWTVLFRVFVPLSKAALATLLLFQLVFHWNEWFMGMIYMNKPRNYPLQTYLRLMLTMDVSRLEASSLEDLILFETINSETSKAAQIFVGALPIIMVYPFLQKHFTKGITLGSVKG